MLQVNICKWNIIWGKKNQYPPLGSLNFDKHFLQTSMHFQADTRMYCMLLGFLCNEICPEFHELICEWTHKYQQTHACNTLQGCQRPTWGFSLFVLHYFKKLYEQIVTLSSTRKKISNQLDSYLHILQFLDRWWYN